MAELSITPDMSLSILKNGRVGSVTAMQPVFAGGQIANGNRLAKLGVEVSRLKKEQTEKEITLTVEQYFWQVVALQEKLKKLDNQEDTWFSDLGTGCIDTIFYSNQIQVRRFKTIDVKGLSDHNAVYVEFNI